MPIKQFRMEYRTLDNSIPEITRYLGRGMRALDIGCGRGSITCCVGEYVYPGKTIGLDPDAESITAAAESIEDAGNTNNIQFLTGDCHELPFEENSFDIVYSHTVTHFLIDPILALKEQRRVVKPGGWVIAAGVRDALSGIRFPHCPYWEKAWITLNAHYERVFERYKNTRVKPGVFMEEERKKIDGYMISYFDPQAGRKCAGWFTEVGLENLEISVRSDTVTYHGAYRFKPGSWDLLPRHCDDEDYAKSEIQKPVDALYKAMVESGEMEQGDLDRAVEERADWYKNPRAFSYYPKFFVAGQK
ncbi:MAG: methyltransferase domain-containing protein [Spirochaetales bacterium]|nr:methyltransferase domain-containing protein [Spirochaetales bacterium]